MTPAPRVARGCAAFGVAVARDCAACGVAVAGGAAPRTPRSTGPKKKKEARV